MNQLKQQFQKLSTFSTDKFALLSFLISLIISSTVIIHSYNYLSNFFHESKIMMIMVVLTIEVCYVVLPYVANINKIKNFKLDMTLITLLFFLSIIPATLQTMVGFTGDLEKNMLSEPIAPIKSGLIESYKSEITDISIQIKSNSTIAEKMAEKGFLSKSQVVMNKNDNLVIKKGKLIKEVTVLESNYLKNKRDYDRKKEKFDISKSKKDFNSIFDILRLSWAFFLIAILQLINGRFIFHGNQIINQSMKKKEKFDEIVINNTEEEIDTSVLSASFYRTQYNIKGIGDTSLTQFSRIFDLTSEKSFLNFVNQENREEELHKYFPKGAASKLNKLCNVIKKRNEKENKK